MSRAPGFGRVLRLAPRNWFPCDAMIGQDPKIAGLPNDTARFAWILTLASAKGQRPEGQWATVAHLDAALPKRYARYVSTLLKAGLLTQDEQGVLRVAAWDRWKHRSYEDNSTPRVVAFRKREHEKAQGS